MTLEEQINKDAAKALEGIKFGIDPDRAYDRGYFVEQAEDFFKLAEYYEKLDKSHGHDADAREDLAKIVFKYMVGNKANQFERLRRDPEKALTIGKSFTSEGADRLAKFVEKKRNDLLDKLSEESLHQLFLSIPLYETGNKEHDRIIMLRNKVSEMEKIAKDGGERVSVLQKELQELIQNAPKEQQEYFSKHPEGIRDIGNDLVETFYKEFKSLFRDKDKKLDKSALIKYLTENYKAAEEEMDKRPEKKKGDFWDDNLKSQYLMLGKQVYEIEKRAQEKADDPKEEAEKERLGAKGYKM